MDILIEVDNYSDLINDYEQKPLDEKHFKILSYLYRLTDQIDKEKALMAKGADFLERDQYYLEREYHYSLPLHDQMEARPPLNEEPEEGFEPDQHILDNLCFVTIGSPGVYHSMIQTIESVKAIADYKNIPFYVIGLPSDPFPFEMHYELVKRYGVTSIEYPDFTKYYPNFAGAIENYKGGVQANYIYPFISQIVNHKYIFFIESDIWVKHRSCLDKHLRHLQTQDFVMANGNMGLHVYDVESELVKEWKYSKSLVQCVSRCNNDVSPEGFLSSIYRPRVYLSDIYKEEICNADVEFFPIKYRINPWSEKPKIKEELVGLLR